MVSAHNSPLEAMRVFFFAARAALTPETPDGR
jgi:hypothetical protein